MDFLDKIILDNSLRNYIIVFSIIFIALLFKRILSHYVASIIFMLLVKKWKFISRSEFTSLTIKPLSWFLVVFIAVFAVDKLNYPSTWLLKIKGMPFDTILERIGDGAVIVSLFYFLVNSINFVALILEKSTDGPNDRSHDQVVVFFRDLLKVLVAFIGLMIILKVVFNQHIGSLLTGLSIVGAALALAAKESIENLIASFIIFLDKPFFTGDTLKVNNVTGTVEHIGLRSTRIRTPDRTLVTVPNKQMVDSVVDNMSMRILRRAEIKLILSEKSTTDSVNQFMQNVSKVLNAKQEEITTSSVHLTEFSKEGVVILIEYFTHPFSKSTFDDLKQEINFSLMKLLEKFKLEMNTAVVPNLSNNITLENIVPPKQDNLL